MKHCCHSNNKTKKCIRKDGKIFNLPRKFSKKKCSTQKIRGFTMRSSCAPYKYCITKKQKGGKSKKKQFLYNPNNPKKSFDVYIDKDPSDTIHIKYTTVDDVKNTIKKLERLYKKGKYPHKRIWQVGMIMKVRVEAIKKHKKTLYTNAKNVNDRFKLANNYFKFLGKRTKKNESDRKKMVFDF
tara:strand:+ start:188 stop:736 length:549 start_codon:yes stop_codon:yes gene_type:complete